MNTSVLETSGTNRTPTNTTGKIFGIIIGILGFCFIVFLVWKRVKCYRYFPVLRENRRFVKKEMLKESFFESPRIDSSSIIELTPQHESEFGQSRVRFKKEQS